MFRSGSVAAGDLLSQRDETLFVLRVVPRLRETRAPSSVRVQALPSLQPQPLAPLLSGGRVPPPLRVPHDPVMRQQPANVTT